MKTAKLIELKAQMDQVANDFQNPQRSQIIADYHAELTGCGRYYFDDRLEAYARDHGALYGEKTMLEMIEDGTLSAEDLHSSVKRHIAKIVWADDADRIEDSAS